MQDEPRELVTYEQAAAMLPEGEVIPVLLGVYHGGSMAHALVPRDQVLRLLRLAGEVDIAGPQSRARGYGLCVISSDGQQAIFIATRKHS